MQVGIKMENDFKAASQLAAAAERRESWILAIELWLKAQELAKEKANKDWAGRRSELCQSYRHKIRLEMFSDQSKKDNTT